MELHNTTLRPRFSRVLTVLVWVIVACALGAFVFTGNVAELGRAVAPLLLLAYLTWMMFWKPSVTVGPAGVEFVNLLRTHRITWPAINRIDTKYALTLYTPTGRFVAWSAPAPSRLAVMRASKQDMRGLPESTYGAENRIGIGDIPSSDSGLASLHVRRHWEHYRDAGLLGEVEGTGVVTTWHRVPMVILAVLVVAVVLSAVV
jgi:hypothetical protein